MPAFGREDQTLARSGNKGVQFFEGADARAVGGFPEEAKRRFAQRKFRSAVAMARRNNLPDGSGGGDSSKFRATSGGRKRCQTPKQKAEELSSFAN